MKNKNVRHRLMSITRFRYVFPLELGFLTAGLILNNEWLFYVMFLLAGVNIWFWGPS